ncbi:MAG TPA: ParB/RepB/Spo0J family partition protein [Patescibacteria group bacterium]
MNKNKGLGRGLGSLIPPKIQKTVIEETKSEALKEVISGDNVIQIPIEDISPNPSQPRKDFSHRELEDLINSIKEHGIIQPLIVTKKADGDYELIAGERRLRAARMLELKTVPAIVREAGAQEKLELALIENIQRKDLNPIEEALAYQQLIDQFNLTQEELSRKVGKSRAFVANTLRLLNLPEEAQKAVIDGKITPGHARTIASLEDPKEQIVFLKKIMASQMTVREAESAARKISVKKHTRTVTVDPLIVDREEKLREFFGTKVKIKKSGQGGRIEIEFYSDEELNEIVSKLSH